MDFSLGRLDFLSLFLGLSSTTSKHAEDIFEAAHATASIFDSLQSVLIVEFSLFSVAQDFIGSVNFFECRLISALVRMMFEGFLTERLFDLPLGRFFINAQHIVQFLAINLFFFFVH